MTDLERLGCEPLQLRVSLDGDVLVKKAGRQREEREGDLADGSQGPLVTHLKDEGQDIGWERRRGSTGLMISLRLGRFSSSG